MDFHNRESLDAWIFFQFLHHNDVDVKNGGLILYHCTKNEVFH